ncbi:hypothetical protein TNCT_695461 [Trichonephila clavata]|uniref:Uncharacterized protein n=1 Tax=Trichonephila clavata TaxID=2740835 RepID=A0A8X6H4J2_TRICU|nr:hypothetical protein TNCT_695461 [Trichonephila clavata]
MEMVLKQHEKRRVGYMLKSNQFHPTLDIQISLGGQKAVQSNSDCKITSSPKGDMHRSNHGTEKWGNSNRQMGKPKCEKRNWETQMGRGETGRLKWGEEKRGDSKRQRRNVENQMRNGGG